MVNKQKQLTPNIITEYGNFKIKGILRGGLGQYIENKETEKRKFEEIPFEELVTGSANRYLNTVFHNFCVYTLDSELVGSNYFRYISFNNFISDHRHLQNQCITFKLITDLSTLDMDNEDENVFVDYFIDVDKFQQLVISERGIKHQNEKKHQN